MVVMLPRPRFRNHKIRRLTRRPHLECLETRTLPSTTAWPGFTNPVAEAPAHATLDQAQDLGDLTTATNEQVQVVGQIGNGPAGAAEVDWYSFTIDNPAQVTLATLDAQAKSSFVSVLSLYTLDFDPTSDPYVPFGFRLLSQDDGASHGGDAGIDRSLAPGTYYVAVSGSGDRYFHPDIAASGYPGSTGPYGLQVTAQDLGLAPTDGPVVLATDLLTNPGDTSSNVIDRSPFLIRLDVSAGLDPTTLNPGQTIQLIDTTTGQPVLINAYFDFSVNELKLAPDAPLAPGDYQLILSGDSSTGNPVILDLGGNPLGANFQQPLGQDFTWAFRVTGAEGTAAGDNTPATAHELGNITNAGITHTAGAIGDDPTDPAPFDPADIDAFHFQVNGPGRFTFRAEVFAGRIGSPLNSEISLFRLDPSDGQLHLIALNDDTQNPTLTFDGSQRALFSDSSLSASLTAGDYYVVVSGSGYVPAALSDTGLPESQSVFDATAAHPFAIPTTGDYILNLSVTPDNVPPRVISVGISPNMLINNGAMLNGPPTGLVVSFSEPVNLPQLAFQQAAQAGDTDINAVFIQDPQGTIYYPRYIGFTDGGSSAQFEMYDALPNSTYQLHLSAALGLTDLAGNPLVGNSPGGDFVLSFTVQGPVRGTSTNPLTFVATGNQNLGPLFPDEVQQGVILQRSPVTNAAHLPPNGDTYTFQLLQNKTYTITLTSSGSLTGAKLTLTDASGAKVRLRTLLRPGSVTGIAFLPQGTYTLRISGWSPSAGYKARLSIPFAHEPAPPLTVGPGPAIPLRSLTGVLPPPPGNNGPDGPPIPPLVLLPAPSTITVGLAPQGSSPFVIPSEILVALGLDQLGASGAGSVAVASKPDVYDRLIAQGTPLLSSDLVVRLPVLLQTLDSGTAQDSGSAEVIFALRGVARSLSKLRWETLVEWLHRVSHWAAQPAPAPGENGDAGFDQALPDDPELPETSSAPGASEAVPEANPEAQAMLAAVALVAIQPWKKRRPNVHGASRPQAQPTDQESNEA